MMKDQIKKLITESIKKLYPEQVGVVFSVDFPPAGVDADFASNVAMILAKKVGKKPMDIANSLAGVIASVSEAIPPQKRLPRRSAPRNDGLAVVIAPPGFLNFKLPVVVWQKELAKVLKEGKKYGTSKIGKGKKARVEYVSANPTGPVHIGNVRGGPYGEVICNVLESQGYKVLREYYHNDVGGQVEKLGKTIWYWYQKLTPSLSCLPARSAGGPAGRLPTFEGGDEVGVEFPEGGYQGEYPKEIAQKALDKFGKNLSEKDLPKIAKFSLDLIFKENLETIKRLGIEFDLIVKESILQKSGKTARAAEELKKRGFTKEKDGALWFIHPSLPPARTLQAGRLPIKGREEEEGEGDREAVIIKGDGQPTYFASDIAYHKDKFTSGYDLVMDVLGSNHYGHVLKLQALTEIYSFDLKKFKILLYQYVRIKRGNEVVKMAKRAGNFITAKEVLDEVGKDSMIFLLLMTAVNTHVDFDLELAKDTSEKNPVFRVQYAHARIESVKRKGKNVKQKSDLALLVQPVELELIRELAKFPELVAEIAQIYNVHHLPHYLLGLADRFHQFYEKVRVISDNERETGARLALVKAVQQVLANGLWLMGITPMGKM